ncbi:MAG: thioredoxin family protein [Desulfovibrionaceae bacterium]
MPTTPMTLVCPSCDALNRVVPDKLGHGPVCGKCRTPLTPTVPTVLDGPRLARLIAKHQLPILADFWSPGCGPCLMMAPAFDEAARRLAPHVRCVKVDTMAHQDAAMRYNIMATPSLVLFRNGREIARQPGAMAADAITAWARARL